MAPRPRTLALRAALSAAAGFLSTIAVAWASAYFYPCPFGASCVPACTNGPTVAEGPGEQPHGWIERYDTHLASFVRVHSPVWFEEFSAGSIAAAFDRVHPRPLRPASNWQPYVPSWALDDAASILLSYRPTTLSVEAHGWPYKSWCFEVCQIHQPGGGPLDLARGRRIPHWNDSQMTAFRGYGAVLPYGPIWPGIALNASLVAVPLFLLTTLAPTLRATLRHRRARCPKCNYDLQGLAATAPCPECGGTR